MSVDADVYRYDEPSDDRPPAGSGNADPHPVDGVTSPVRTRRLGPRSLTARLVTGVVVLVALLVFVIGTTTYFVFRGFLDERFATQLGNAKTQNAGFFDRCVSEATPRGSSGALQCVSGPQFQQEWVLAYHPDSGQLYTFNSNYGTAVRALNLSSSQLDALVNDPNTILTTEQDGTELRVSAAESSRDGLLVATGLSTQEVNQTLRQLVFVELVIGLIAVAVAVFATTYGVRLSLRGLRRVTATAQDVATELSPEGRGLDRRVPLAEHGTEVGQLAESMNTLLGAVETQFAARLESEQRMRQFLADASHELRTPLTSIRGYAELARMQRAAGDESHDNLDRIESEGTRMSRLVEDLLMLARGDSAQERAGDHVLVDVGALIDDAVSGTRASYPDRVIRADATVDVHVVGDRDQLLRVVRNLVTNAATHTAADRPIDVRARADAEGVTIQVVDGGPGLPPHDAAHVFERFWRADKARTRARGGSGLGLAIVASIVRAHGGMVRFDSAVETGSTVTVWLPGAHPA